MFIARIILTVLGATGIYYAWVKPNKIEGWYTSLFKSYGMVLTPVGVLLMLSSLVI